MEILSDNDIENVAGGFDGSTFVWSTLGAIGGSALAVAGLGTPISIAGAALAAGCAIEAGAAFYMGGSGSSSAGGNIPYVYIEHQHDAVQI